MHVLFSMPYFKRQFVVVMSRDRNTSTLEERCKTEVSYSNFWIWGGAYGRTIGMRPGKFVVVLVDL